jgi:hypothetical protein
MNFYSELLNKFYKGGLAWVLKVQQKKLEKQ